MSSSTKIKTKVCKKKEQGKKSFFSIYAGKIYNAYEK